MRNQTFSTSVLVACLAFVCAAPTVHAQISLGVQLQGVSIGINVPVYPRLERVPGYPVYYDPRADSNYFFYDGLYWVYRDDVWYESSWYNGPWRVRESAYVPDYVLQVPVRYYRRPPTYFRGWRAEAAPRWDEHWGREWQQGRPNWNRQDYRAMPAPAPLPTYQRRYNGDRYPQEREQQQALHERNYRYQPRDISAQPPPHVQQPQHEQRQPSPEQHQQRQPAPEQREQRQPAPEQRGRPDTPNKGDQRSNGDRGGDKGGERGNHGN